MTVKLLLVDDNKLALKCMALCAAKQAWLDVSTASSASQALELVELRGPFDVIISDYSMPGMNGIDLLRIFKEQQPESLRFLQPSSVEINNVSDAIQEGIVLSFFSKPVMAADINAMLMSTCMKEISLDHAIPGT